MAAIGIFAVEVIVLRAWCCGWRRGGDVKDDEEDSDFTEEEVGGMGPEVVSGPGTGLSLELTVVGKGGVSLGKDVVAPEDVRNSLVSETPSGRFASPTSRFAAVVLRFLAILLKFLAAVVFFVTGATVAVSVTSFSEAMGAELPWYLRQLSSTCSANRCFEAESFRREVPSGINDDDVEFEVIIASDSQLDWFDGEHTDLGERPYPSCCR